MNTRKDFQAVISESSLRTIFSCGVCIKLHPIFGKDFGKKEIKALKTR